MAAKDKMGRAGKAARLAKENAYLQRVIADAELRNNLRSAYDSARTAYVRLSNGKAPTRALLEDKKLQKELRNAALALKEASSSLREPPKRRRSRGTSRGLLLLLAGAALAVVLSEGLRSKLLDALFGAEEEFDYASTTTPPAPATEPVAAS